MMRHSRPVTTGWGLSRARNSQKCLAGIITGFFLFQTIVPPAVSAAGAHVSAGELWRHAPSFPSLPVGFQAEQGLRNPKFYVHHRPDPINARNGNLFLAYQDIFITARGFPLEVSRAYNSRGIDKGIFGYGWSSSLDTVVAERHDGLLRIRDWGGSIKEYRPDGRAGVGSGEKHFIPVAPSIEYVVKHRDGTYTRSLGNGKKESYSRTGKILKKLGVHGNGLTFSYDQRGERLLAVSDGAGRKLQFESTASGLIHTITDPVGRRLAYRYDASDNLISVTDFGGATTQFSYDSGHNLTALIQANGSRITNVYDPAADRVVAQEGPGRKRTTYQYEFPQVRDATQRTVVTDAAGNQTTYTYLEAAGSVSRLTITDPAGGNTVEEYDALGNLVRRIDANGSRRAYEYDGYGRLLRETEPVGGVWRYVYEAGCTCANPASITNPLGQTTTVKYNEKFEVAEMTNPLGHSTRFAYSTQGDVLEKISPNGARTRYNYDAYGNLAQVTSPSGTITTYVRDSLGRITEVVRPGGERYRYQYDALDRLVEVANALGYRVALTYDRVGRLSKIADQDGAFAFDYDEAGQVVGLRDREGNTLRAGYDTVGNVVRLVDGGGNEWTFAYDKMSRLIRAVDPLNQATSLSYDPVGNLVALTKRAGERTAVGYDRNNRPVELTDAAGNRTEFRYDPVGRRVAVVDAERRETRYSYDAAGQLVASVNALGQKMEYRYDTRGKVVEQVDATGGMTHLQYDAEGRLLRKTDQLGRVTSYQYNSSGRVERVTRPDTHAIRFEYTALGRLAKIVPQQGDPIAFAYDNRGQLIEGREGEFAYRYKYNRMGKLTEVEDVKRKRVLRHAYDSRNNRVRTELLPDARRTEYAYDAVSRLVSLKTDSGDYRFTYDTAGRRASLFYPNQVETSYGYDKAGRLIELLTVDSRKAVLLRERYEYDRVGSIVRKAGKNGEVTSYKYDPLDRLVEARHPDGVTEAFTYDAMGNILSRSGPDGIVRSTFNKAHQLETAGDTRFDYDANGNMIRRVANAGTSQYRYDDFNRLREVTLPDGRSLSYAYGPDGQRVAEKRGGVETHTVYDGDNPVLKLDGQLRPISSLTFGPGLDEALAETAAGTKRFFHGDVVRSVIALTDERGARVSTVAYGAFGRPVTTAGTSPSFSFTGRPYDRDTGLLSFRFRDHDPAQGRFLQQDPLELLLGWQAPYVYASNNPVNRVDLYGLIGLLDVGKGLLGAVGIVAAGAAAVTVGGVAGAVIGLSAGIGMAVNYFQSAGSNTDASTTLLNVGIGAATGAAAAGLGVLAAGEAAAVAAASLVGEAWAGATTAAVSLTASVGLGALNSKLTGGVPGAGGVVGFGGWLAGIVSPTSAWGAGFGIAISVLGGVFEAAGQAIVGAGQRATQQAQQATDPTPTPTPSPTWCPPSPAPSPTP